MTLAEMLGQSGVLTLMGMGTVFLFLIITVICVTVMGKIFQGLRKNGTIPEAKPEKLNPAAENKTDQDAVIAAISAALSQYRKE
jgi:oxaloacetate decarboxylase gamma subunit